MPLARERALQGPPSLRRTIECLAAEFDEMTTDGDIPLEAPAAAYLSLPHPTDRSRLVRWTGNSFDVDGKPVRVLAFAVAPSGWTEDLTRLHEDVGGSDHFIDIASRAHAVNEAVRVAGPAPPMIVEIGCSSGFLLRELMVRLPGHFFLGSDYTYGTLETLGNNLPAVPLVQFHLTQCPLHDAFADVVILLNVLEHIDDDEVANQ